MEENKMGVLPEGRLLLKMAAPMVASMLFQALYNIVDSVIVAMLNQDALNAVSLAFPLQILCIAFASGTGVGMSALLSRALGAKDQKTADKVANTGIFVFICTAVVFCIIGLTVPEPFYRFQTSNEQIVSYGKDYLSVILSVSFFLFGQMCFERLLQSTGRTNLAMIPQIVGACLNMILDPIMVLGLFGCPKMEVKGAAIATVIGQFVATVIGLVLNIKKNKEINIDFRQVRPHKETILTIYRIGLPSIFMQAISSVMNFGYNKILIGFTEAATAAFGAYYKIQSFIFMPIFGINNAYIPIMSYNYGARKPERVRKTLKITLIVSITIMSIGCLAFELFPAALISVFSPSEEMLRVGVVAFRTIGSHFPLAGFCIIAASTCQALGKPTYSLINSICRQLVVLLPAAYLLSLTGKLNLVWLSFPIAEVFALTMMIFFLRKTMKVLNYDEAETLVK
ncbi:MAG: MATE family efflux transporter [Eubacteriales bacterium]|nr:MATE family efflux transporter [Eubacteriales bacterium]